MAKGRPSTKEGRPFESQRASVTGKLLGVGLDVAQPAAGEERLLGEVVELALAHAVERLDRVLDGHEGAGLTGELLGHDEVLAEEALETTGATDEDLVLLGELVHAE